MMVMRNDSEGAREQESEIKREVESESHYEATIRMREVVVLHEGERCSRECEQQNKCKKRERKRARQKFQL